MPTKTSPAKTSGKATPPKLVAKKEGSKKSPAVDLKLEKEVAQTLSAASEIVILDLEEMEEQEEAAAQSSHSTNGNAAALAAAAGTSSEMSASFKNFRHHPDMENFYRFIYENDLRHEALAIIDEMMTEKQQRKLVKTSKAQAH